jgi:signal peptidase I
LVSPDRASTSVEVRAPVSVPSLPVPVPVPTLDDVPERRNATRPATRNWQWIAEWAAVAVIALGLAVVVRTYVAQMFFIPSGSMLPTLQIGDRIVVDKLSYDLGSVHRGDIVVFAKPPLEQADYTDLVKRVIGLPGDVISVSDGHVDIDGRPLAEPWLPDPPPPTYPSPVPAPFSLQHPYRVPAGEYYVMGDNRTDSEDSRYFGPISGSLIVGKMALRVWPPDDTDAMILLSVVAAALAMALVVEWRTTRPRPRPSRRPRHRRARPLPG